jgi:hypothetical protein
VAPFWHQIFLHWQFPHCLLPSLIVTKICFSSILCKVFFLRGPLRPNDFAMFEGNEIQRRMQWVIILLTVLQFVAISFFR